MQNSPELEFFYDCSSPWTYFAFTRIIPVAEELGVTIRWRPILVGGVFNAVNDSVYEQRANPVIDCRLNGPRPPGQHDSGAL